MASTGVVSLLLKGAGFESCSLQFFFEVPEIGDGFDLHYLASVTSTKPCVILVELRESNPW